MTDYLTTDGPAICLLLHRIMSTESVGRPRGHAFLINRCRWLAPVMRDAPPFPRPRWRSIKTLLLTFLAGDWDSALLVDVGRRGRGTQTDLLLNNAFTASHSTTGGVLFFAGICSFVCLLQHYIQAELSLWSFHNRPAMSLRPRLRFYIHFYTLKKTVEIIIIQL